MVKHKIRIKGIDKITIVPAGDIHYGSPNCAWDKFSRMLKWAEGEKDHYVYFMGDIFDVILATDKRYNAEERQMPLLQAIDNMVRVLQPLAEKGKIIGMHTGNHEYKMSCIGVGDPVEDVCKRLNVKYLGYSAYTQIVAEHQNKTVNALTIYSHHGFFSGRKRGSKINSLEDLSMYYDADLYLAGHSHDLISTKRVFITYHGQKVRAFLNTGTFLKTSEYGTSNYSERAGYPPQKLGVARVEWQPFKETHTEIGRQKGDLHIIE